jgi:hypothetical protein
MTAEERDNWELLNFKMDSEGFDYCFRKYSSWSEIEDETLHQLIDQYVEMAEKLENYISEKFQEAIDSDYK